MFLYLFNRIGLIVVLSLTISECNGQDLVYKSYNSYRRRNRNFNDDELKRFVDEEVQRIENSALQLHALSFSNYPGFLTTQRIRRNVDSNVNNKTDNFINILNEIKAIEIKENNLKQLWNGKNLFKKRRQEGMFLNTTAEKLHEVNKARNTVYRAINNPHGNNTKGDHRFRIRRMLNELNDDLNTVNTKQFDDYEVSSLRTEEFDDVTSNDYSYENTFNNKNKTTLLGLLTNVENITEELTSNVSSSIAQTTTDTVKNYENFKNESKNIEITTQATKYLNSTKIFKVLNNVTSNEFHQNKLNKNKSKTNLPESSSPVNIDVINSGTISKVLSTSVSKSTTTSNIVKHLEQRKDDETSTQLITTAKETLGSRIIINRVLQRNEVEARPIMQMMTTLTFDGPQEGPVLIQVPPRRIICPPHQRVARGRCRTRW